MFYEIMCIATAIYFEARGEPISGQYAVGQVIMNRTYDPRYPDDACSVVYDGGETKYECQFSFYCDGKSDQPTDEMSWRVAQLIARAVYEGAASPVIGQATHYHSVNVQPWWATTGHVVAKISDHVFYEEVK